MGVEWVAGLLVALAAICLGGAAWLFFRDIWFMQWLRGTAGFVLVGAALSLVLVSASLFSYQQINGDAPLATLSFQKAGDQLWNVTIAEANGVRRAVKLPGDIWQLDVRLLRYTGIAGIFDTKPSFQLEQLRGTYLSMEDEEGKEHIDHNLLAPPLLGFDLWHRAHDGGSFLVDAARSNVALVPIADGAIYAVAMGDTGLKLIAENSAAEAALKQVGP